VAAAVVVERKPEMSAKVGRPRDEVATSPVRPPRESTPVLVKMPLLYDKPVPALNNPLIYEGVSAVVEAAAAFQLVMSPPLIPKAAEPVKTGSSSVKEVR